jgi:divalent metal cation (Fe/Co/Zn/Cd) transporter
MIREVIEVKAFDILVQMQFFESAQIKALLHLEYLGIKLTNTLVMHALILLSDLSEGLFDFIVSILFIIGDRLQM